MMIKGKVIKGESKGRMFGFPTANIIINNEAKDGVYAGNVYFQEKKYKAGIFVKDNILEAHILDFSGDLYGESIEVKIGKKIRDVIKFSNNKELKKQITKDIEIIKNVHRNY